MRGGGEERERERERETVYANDFGRCRVYSELGLIKDIRLGVEDLMSDPFGFISVLVRTC